MDMDIVEHETKVSQVLYKLIDNFSDIVLRDFQQDISNRVMIKFSDLNTKSQNGPMIMIENCYYFSSFS